MWYLWEICSITRGLLTCFIRAVISKFHLSWNSQQQLIEKNFLSSLLKEEVLSVHIDQPNKLGDKCELPFRIILKSGERRHLFAKFSPNHIVKSALTSFFKFFDNEENFFNTIYPSLRDNFPEIPRTYYCSQKRGYFLLIMDDVTQRTSPVHFYNMFDSAYDGTVAESIIRALAKLHAKYWNSPPHSIWRYNPTTGDPDGNTPMFYRLFAKYGIERVQSRLQGQVIFPGKVMKACDLVIKHFPVFRKYWSTGPLTCCHGDAHLGNVFVDMATKEVGLVDFQCVAQEHGMRDIAYFLIHSYESQDLVAHEEALVRLYLIELTSKLKERDQGEELVATVPTFETAMFMFRSQAIWALFTWVICCCFAKGEKLELARTALQRVLNSCERLCVLEALEEILYHEKHQ